MIRGIESKLTIIGIYVDDLLITGGDNKEIYKVVVALKNRFEVKDLGDAHWARGMRINITKMGISLDQSKFASEIVQKFYYPGSLIYNTPMDVGAITSLTQNLSDKLDENDRLTFHGLLGKLNWLCNTRPDVL